MLPKYWNIYFRVCERYYRLIAQYRVIWNARSDSSKIWLQCPMVYELPSPPLQTISSSDFPPKNLASFWCEPWYRTPRFQKYGSRVLTLLENKKYLAHQCTGRVHNFPCVVYSFVENVSLMTDKISGTWKVTRPKRFFFKEWLVSDIQV